MMIAALALACVLTGPGPVPGVLVSDGPPGLARFWPDTFDVDRDYGRLIVGHDVDVVHEAEPHAGLPLAAALDRRVTIDDLPSRPLLTIRGGLAPARWQSVLLSPPPPAAFDRALVRALGSPRYATRSAARDTLVRRGEASLGALLDGLADADPEVRERCSWALDEIRTGVR